MRNPWATLAVVGWFFAWPAAAGADAPTQPDLPVVTPVVAALATLAPEVAEWPRVGDAPAPPAATPRARVKPVDTNVWVMSVVDVCATVRRVTVDVYSSLAAAVTVRVYDQDDRTLARVHVPQTLREQTVTLAPRELRRGRSYWVGVEARRSNEEPFKHRRRVIARSACR